MADLILPALARILAESVPGIGHVYDQSDADPTPDAVTLPADGRPPCIFLDPTTAQYDTDGGSGRVPTLGLGGITNDRSTIRAVLLIGPLAPTKVGTLQRRARPFLRYAVKDAVRQHNTLKGTVWRAYVADAKAGPFSWGSPDGSPNWYACEFTIIVDDDREVTAGS